MFNLFKHAESWTQEIESAIAKHPSLVSVSKLIVQSLVLLEAGNYAGAEALIAAALAAHQALNPTPTAK